MHGKFLKTRLKSSKYRNMKKLAQSYHESLSLGRNLLVEKLKRVHLQ